MKSKKAERDALCCGNRFCWAEAASLHMIQKIQVVLNACGFWMYVLELYQLATVTTFSTSCADIVLNTKKAIDQTAIVVSLISATTSTCGVLAGLFLVIQAKEARRDVFAWWATSSIVNLTWEIASVGLYGAPHFVLALHGRLCATMNGIAYVLARFHLIHHKSTVSPY